MWITLVETVKAFAFLFDPTAFVTLDFLRDIQNNESRVKFRPRGLSIGSVYIPFRLLSVYRMPDASQIDCYNHSEGQVVPPKQKKSIEHSD